MKIKIETIAAAGMRAIEVAKHKNRKLRLLRQPALKALPSVGEICPTVATLMNQTFPACGVCLTCNEELMQFYKLT